MIGPTRLSNPKQNIVEEFISRVNPYEKMTPLKFDLRSYSKYVKENKISADKITPDILKKFSK